MLFCKPAIKSATVPETSERKIFWKKSDANTPSTSDSFSLGAKYTPQHSSPSIEQGKKRIYG